MAQDSILVGIKGFKVRVGNSNLEFTDYCPLFEDCTPKILTQFKNKDNVYLAGIERFKGKLAIDTWIEEDKWVKGFTSPFETNSSAPEFCVAGYKPQFNLLYTLRPEHSSSGYIDITVSSLNLTISSPGSGTIFSRQASFFKDRVIPKRLLLVMQGGGGGGGSSYSINSGSGGGSGGLIVVILNLEKTSGKFQIKVGAGGAGGEDGNEGGYGEDTILFWKENNKVRETIASAGGGESGTSSSGGAGGKCYFNSTFLFNEYFYTTFYDYFYNGTSGGHGGNNGESTTLRHLYATNDTNFATGINVLTLNPKSGGSKGDPTTGGGGGASCFANGGNLGDVASDGQPGTLGSGGGGGRYTFLTFKKGGKGGDGFVEIYY